MTRPLAVGTGLMLALFILWAVSFVLILTGRPVDGAFKQHCFEAGGHIYAPDRFEWCLKDGAVLEVYP